MISHHPQPELLLDHAAGVLNEAVHLVVASHVVLCPECRDEVAVLEAAGGAMLETLPPIDMSATALDAVLERLDDAAPARRTSRYRVDQQTAAVVPPPLLRQLGRNLADLKWRRLGRMVEEAKLSFSTSGFRASLMRVGAGAKLPVHTHRGNEYTLVLAGGYKDNGRQFVRGDFDWLDTSHQHQPVVDGDDACLCFVVIDAPIRITRGLGRLVNPFLRI